MGVKKVKTPIEYSTSTCYALIKKRDPNWDVSVRQRAFLSRLLKNVMRRAGCKAQASEKARRTCEYVELLSERQRRRPAPQ